MHEEALRHFNRMPLTGDGRDHLRDLEIARAFAADEEREAESITLIKHVLRECDDGAVRRAASLQLARVYEGSAGELHSGTRYASAIAVLEDYLARAGCHDAAVEYALERLEHKRRRPLARAGEELDLELAALNADGRGGRGWSMRR